MVEAILKYQGKVDRFLRNVSFIQRLPYSEELRLPLGELAQVYLRYEKNIDEALYWNRVLQQLAEQHHDLRALAEACNSPEAFRSFCSRFREEHPEAGTSPLRRWFLEPTEADVLAGERAVDEFTASLSSDWVWQDLFGDCSFTVGHGLEIQAVNGRSLWHLNRSAPRLLQPAAGPFAVQTVCAVGTAGV